MDNKKVCNILYNLASDMDYADYIDVANNELMLLTNSIDHLEKNDNLLYQLLLSIAYSYENMYKRFI